MLPIYSSMKAIYLSIACDAVLLFFFGGLLWVVLRRRNWWLRWCAVEEAFYARLRLPSRFIAASRKFYEGRGVIYFAAAGTALSVVLLVASLILYFRMKSEINHPHPRAVASISTAANTHSAKAACALSPRPPHSRTLTRSPMRLVVRESDARS